MDVRVVVGYNILSGNGPAILNGVSLMARKSNKEVTSKKAASAAAKALRNPKSSKAAKSAAASALTQRPDRKKKK